MKSFDTILNLNNIHQPILKQENINYHSLVATTLAEIS
jgi:hypothetical protein